MFENKSKTELASMAAKGVASFCVGTVVKRFLDMYTPQDPDSKFDRVKVRVGSYVLAGIIVDHAAGWAGKQVDEVVDAWAESKAKKAESDTPATVTSV